MIDITTYEAIQVAVEHLQHVRRLNVIAATLLNRRIKSLERLTSNPEISGMPEEEFKKMVEQHLSEPKAPSLVEAQKELVDLLGEETMSEVYKYIEAAQIIEQTNKEKFSYLDHFEEPIIEALRVS